MVQLTESGVTFIQFGILPFGLITWHQNFGHKFDGNFIAKNAKINLKNNLKFFHSMFTEFIL
jgi:hypothetical protein